MITAEEVIIPTNRRVGRPRIPKAYTQTEEYKNNRKKNRHKIDSETKCRTDNMKRRKYIPQDGEKQNYYYAFHEKGELALKRRQTMERLRLENHRNKVKINKLKTKSTEPTIFQSPNANILQEVSCIDNETGKQFIVNFLTSEIEKKLVIFCIIL
jgi:hypothetical protein